MDIMTEQFDDAETTRRKMEEAQSAAADSINSVLNMTAAANGAGLVAMVGYFPTQELSSNLLSVLTFAGLMFAVGLICSGYAKLNAHYRLTVVELAYRQKLQAHQFKKHFEPHLSDDDRKVFFDNILANGNAALSLEVFARQKRDRWASWSLCLFLFGFVVLTLAVLGQKSASLPTPVAQQRCIALETDMLRAKPTRQDSRALFQALGCKPQTDAPLQISKPSRTNVS
ncbi:hypothetical protein [Novosphingobium sp.]|uniref:hypothetical protein n=1 Tax=Novosphingobium sp. TaxID=1874826 RepID=UPI002FDF832D